jgi:hypothetical protein
MKEDLKCMPRVYPSNIKMINPRCVYSTNMGVCLYGGLRYSAQNRIILCRIILPLVACVALPYSSTFSHKLHDFQKASLNIKFMFSLYLQPLSENSLILRRIRGGITINVLRYSRKVPLIVGRF